MVWVYWLSLGMAGLILAIGYAQNVAARDDFLPWLGLVLGFGAGAATLRWCERQVHSRVFVNVSGVGSIEPSGRRRIILWSELVAVRSRPWLTQVDFHGRGSTRRIVASYYLERFPRLMELVAARCRGEWGSESAVFIALRAGAEIRFACAVIVVHRPIELRDGTTFAITGRLHTGPLVLDHPPEIRGAGRVVGSSVALTLPMPAGDVVTLDLTAGVRPDPADLPTCPQQMGWPGGTPDHPMPFSLRVLRPRRG